MVCDSDYEYVLGILLIVNFIVCYNLIVGYNFGVSGVFFNFGCCNFFWCNIWQIMSVNFIVMDDFYNGIVVSIGDGIVNM